MINCHTWIVSGRGYRAVLYMRYFSTLYQIKITCYLVKRFCFVFVRRILRVCFYCRRQPIKTLIAGNKKKYNNTIYVIRMILIIYFFRAIKYELVYLGIRSGEVIFLLAGWGNFFSLFPDIDIPRGRLWYSWIDSSEIWKWFKMYY